MEATGAMATCLICEGDTDAFASSIETVQKFLAAVGRSKSGTVVTGATEVILCNDCLSGVVKAVKWREEMDEVERDVRSLQRIILKMMRQIKSLQGSYLGEMRRLEGKIRDNEKGTPGPRAAAGSSTKRQGSAGIPDKAEVFRQGILDVVVDLSAFQNRLDAQIGGSVPPEVAVQTASNNPTNSDQATATLVQQFPLEDSIIKKEVGSGSLEETTCAPGAPMGESLFDQNPFSTENDDPIDIEHVVYSEDLFKTEPRSVEPTVDFDLPDTPTATTLRPVKSRMKGSTKQLRHACRFCGKKFSSPSELKRHVNTHTGERPFKCHLCPKAFKNNDHLTRHLMGHSGKKPFKCAQCKRGFTRKDHLEIHKRTHTGEKPYKCPVCGQKFCAGRWLKQHLKKKHPKSQQQS